MEYAVVKRKDLELDANAIDVTPLQLIQALAKDILKILWYVPVKAPVNVVNAFAIQEIHNHSVENIAIVMITPVKGQIINFVLERIMVFASVVLASVFLDGEVMPVNVLLMIVFV